jgi:hypothetical protein
MAKIIIGTPVEGRRVTGRRLRASLYEEHLCQKLSHVKLRFLLNPTETAVTE